MTDTNDRQNQQEALYGFPYHYVPQFDSQGGPKIHWSLSWGLDYLTYMSFIAETIVGELNPRSVLDVGCGDARLLSMLRDKVPRLVGVDTFDRAVAFARAFNPGLEVHCGDVGEVPGSFDVVTMIEVLEHVPSNEISTFIDRVAEKVLPEGRMIVSVPTTNAPVAAKHHRHYDLSLLSAHLGEWFQIERHWFLVKRSLRLRVLRGMLQNHLIIAVPSAWRRLVWRMHKAQTYFADESNGEHLIVLARRRDKRGSTKPC